MQSSALYTMMVANKPSAQQSSPTWTRDARGFHDVVSTHQKEILAYCIRFLGDQEQAKDVTQEVFLTLWQERERYSEEGKLRFYLLKVARLRCLATLKKRHSLFRLRTKVQKTRNSAREAMPGEEHANANLIQHGLKQLKPEFADVLILRHLQGLNMAEIQEVTGLREGTIKSRISRGLDLLRKEFADVQ
jgi:RNA polymerase sigma-70 factor (ECF subfamily)